jgi:hypothetical protein
MGNKDRVAADADAPEAKGRESARMTIPAPKPLSAEDDSTQGTASSARPTDSAAKAEQIELERFGSLTRVPRLAISVDALRQMTLDPATSLLLWLVDGKTSLQGLLDVCGMPRIQAVRIFGSLSFLGVIEFEQPGGP